VLGTGVTQRDKLGVQTRADAGQHLQAQVLLALLDTRYRALAGAQQLREIALG